MIVFVEVYLVIVFISALIVGIWIRKAPVVEDETMAEHADLASKSPPQNRNTIHEKALIANSATCSTSNSTRKPG